MLKLAYDIINGKRLNRNTDLSLFASADLPSLAQGADTIRQSLFGNKADLCTIINGRSGLCSEDCKFCAQSSHNHTGCDIHSLITPQTALTDCLNAQKNGINAYSIVTAGRTVTGPDLDKLVDIYTALSQNCSIRLCASHGFLTSDALKRLKSAGVSTYHCNLETSRRFFPHICTTHTYDDKINQIKTAQSAGLNVCSGGIIGMGETFADRIDMALTIAELGIKSIPINALIPVKGTPLGNIAPLTKADIIRTVAMFRYINPTAYIRIAAGRCYFSDGGTDLFKSGANAALTGDMLTTSGTCVESDTAMFKKLGFDTSNQIQVCR